MAGTDFVRHPQRQVPAVAGALHEGGRGHTESVRAGRPAVGEGQDDLQEPQGAGAAVHQDRGLSGQPKKEDGKTNDRYVARLGD